MKITFVLTDTFETRMRLTHENEYIPYKKRVVQIELTPMQLEKIQPRKVGFDKKNIYEEITDCWIENEEINSIYAKI